MQMFKAATFRLFDLVQKWKENNIVGSVMTSHSTCLTLSNTGNAYETCILYVARLFTQQTLTFQI